MANLSDFKKEINHLRLNPAGIQRKSLELLERVNKEGDRLDLDVVDPSNPFVFLLEASALNASAAMSEAANLTRQLYPTMATTEEELYLHMSDKDYVGRFANPSRTVFKLLFDKEELIQRAVAGSVDGVRKITIPRNTEFKVSDYVFTMEYPIEMRIMGHGGIQVVYDVSNPSPLQTVESNGADWDVVKVQGREFVQITIPVHQFELKSHFASINQSTGYSKTFSLNDHFYHCRVYRSTSTGRWEEIKTTHTDQVFDPFDPTVILKVLDGTLKVTVPHVYVLSGTLNRELRIDIYTTKGPLDVILDSYEINAFSVKWKDANSRNLDRYSAPLNVFTTMAVFSDSTVGGGSNPLGFDELRNRVVMNALGNASLPITNVQLEGQLSNKGYRAIKDVDNVTNRIFLASRQLPPPSSGTSISGPGCFYGKMQSRFSELVLLDPIVDNGERITITPELLYKKDNGITSPLTNQETTDLLALEGENFLQEVNGNTYLYSPFHYVLDATNNYFETRAYYLENPQITRREFIAENDQLGIQGSSNRLTVEKIENGYKLQLVTNSDQGFKDLDDERITVQIGYRPKGERRSVFSEGEMVGLNDAGERIYDFFLESNFDVDEEDGLALTNFAMYVNEFRPYHIDLEGVFDIVFFINGVNTDEVDNTEIDYANSSFMINPDAIGLSHESVTIRFGWNMEGFWTNARSIISSRLQSHYETDVQAIYEENVYERDPNTGNIKLSVNADGEIEYNLLYEKGELVYDSEGEPVYKHRKGDPVVDTEGQPVYRDERDILREFDIFLVDSKYFFATQDEDVGYRNELPKTLVDWLHDDIKQFRNWTLEKTDIYLYVQPTIGTGRVYVEENEHRTIELEQSLTITFYQSRDKYNDLFVRQVLNELAVETVSEAFTSRRITKSDIVTRLLQNGGSDIIAVDIEGLGGDNDYTTITLQDDVERCSIAKRLERTADGFYQVVDDVNVVFILHESH